jgi:hypothetical protein
MKKKKKTRQLFKLSVTNDNYAFVCKSLPFEMNLGKTSYICKSLFKDNTLMMVVVSNTTM